MKLAPTLVFAWLASAAYSKLTARSMQVHEKRDLANIPLAFEAVGPAPPDTMLNLRMALVQGNISALEKALMDVSTPDSPLYGQHLTKEQVEALVAPKPESVAAVNGWLGENGIQATTISPAGDWLSFSIPVSKANTLLGADFTVFNHTPTGNTMIRTLEYSIPADLVGHLDLVHPTTTFTQPFQKPSINFTPLKNKRDRRAVNISSDAVPASCSATITPTCLEALYGIPTTPALVQTNMLGVSGFLQQFANQEDLKTFLINFRPDANTDTKFSLLTLDGGSNSQVLSEAGIEANLDTQYTIGVATSVPTTFISVGSQNRDDLNGFLDIIQALLSESNPPQVLTTSYGANENEISANLAKNLCTAYMQLGARGTSILFSSGDGGVSGTQDQQCKTFVPSFPSGCPFLTSVGATAGIAPEVAATFSSGGFSEVFATPSYQAAAVSQYLNTLGSTNAGLFNPAGRGFPDISAQGENVEIVFQQQFGTVAGTSCSTPIMAGIFALINDRLAQQNKPPLGFLNPLLYSAQGVAAFTDITSGNNPGCNTNGFPARAGWDPVTGLGTPNFAALLAAVGL
ncbi:family S53 protease [Lenzites betulinus]|nr:family S53 protease [Lenzites betulinus]